MKEFRDLYLIMNLFWIWIGNRYNTPSQRSEVDAMRKNVDSNCIRLMFETLFGKVDDVLLVGGMSSRVIILSW